LIIRGEGKFDFSPHRYFLPCLPNEPR
jgi:hypothetical protein